MKATLSQYRQSPRKVRVVANLIKGKKISDALATLNLAAKSASLPLKKLLESAVANAKNAGVATDSLIVKTITVDGGEVMKRQMPRAFGRAYMIKKRTSHISIVLGEKEVKGKKGAKVEKVETVEVKKAAKKAPAKKVAKKITSKKASAK